MPKSISSGVQRSSWFRRNSICHSTTLACSCSGRRNNRDGSGSSRRSSSSYSSHSSHITSTAVVSVCWLISLSACSTHLCFKTAEIPRIHNIIVVLAPCAWVRRWSSGWGLTRELIRWFEPRTDNRGTTTDAAANRIRTLRHAPSTAPTTDH